MLTATGLSLPGRLAATDVTSRAGEVVALTGAPGSGKSTLLACLAGLLEPGAGRVVLSDGRAAPWTWPAGAVSRTFGVVFQNPEHQFLTGAVRSELEHGQDPGDPVVAARVDDLLARLHLTHLAEVDPFSLSGGEQRRLSVGTALVAGPEVLLLDEPTFGQDPTTWRELVAIIAEHRDAGGAVVMATHDPLLVGSLAAREVRLTGVADLGRTGDPGPGRSPPTRAGSRCRRPAGCAAWTPWRCSPRQPCSASPPCSPRAFRSTWRSRRRLWLAALLGGLSPRWVGLLAVPALVATGSVALSNALLSEESLLSVESWRAAALPASRVLAVAIPGLVAAASMDPTGLADSLVTRLRVGPRVAYSVLAGLRLLPLLADEWRVLARASRARGLGGRGPVARLRLFGSIAFRLLVSALRRGGRLALALDARGLTGSRDRTIARPMRWRIRDTLSCLLGLALLVVAVGTRAS